MTKNPAAYQKQSKPSTAAQAKASEIPRVREADTRNKQPRVASHRY